ncbi:hypothetical protein [Phenylobacterium sp.]|uniref:hypothetical protein n=1 Tax=Phenylobacterium sp. TaxID=1871053 RepID=UPI002F943A3A
MTNSANTSGAERAATPALNGEWAISEVQCRNLFQNIREGFFVGEIVRDDAGRRSITSSSKSTTPSRARQI